MNSAPDMLGEVKWNQKILFHIEFTTLSVDSSLVILYKFILLREKIRENFCVPHSRDHRLTTQQANQQLPNNAKRMNSASSTIWGCGSVFGFVRESPQVSTCGDSLLDWNTYRYGYYAFSIRKRSHVAPLNPEEIVRAAFMGRPDSSVTWTNLRFFCEKR